MTKHAFAVGAVLTAAASSISYGQLIRPDSATATSEFSGSYLVGNAINGSGLPANFTLNDEHATYATNNHWTTQTNQTIGESATFSFNTAQSLGVFHMWNHRSNGVASNPYYEPVLFDLVLFDGPNGTGATLATFASLTALPNVANAQSIPFTITPGVRSVRFIVRATENGSVSPFTGLAEVAFGPCAAVTLSGTGQPAAVAACPGEAASFVVVPTGSGPFNFLWQWRDGENGEWVNVSEGVNPPVGQALFAAVGAQSQGMTVYPQPTWPLDGARSFRVVVTNQCGEVTSQGVPLAIAPADVGGPGGLPGRDGLYDNNDFIAFINFFFEADPAADMGRAGGLFGPDGVFDNNDFVSFIAEFFAAC